VDSVTALKRKLEKLGY